MTLYEQIQKERELARVAHENDPENPDRFLDKAKRIVREIRTAGADETFREDIYVVWFSKTLQNWKALLSTTGPDTLYYELTYDGVKKVAYVDTYEKLSNVAVRDIGAPDPLQLEG